MSLATLLVLGCVTNAVAAATPSPVATVISPVTTRVSVSSNGRQINGSSGGLAMSASGRVVAFTSDDAHVVRGDTNGTFDVFVRIRDKNLTRRVSVGSGGKQGNGESFEAALSRSGRYVAFASSASNLVAGDTDASADVFVRDRRTGTTQRASVATDGTQGDRGTETLEGFDISANGRYVVFVSQSTNLVPGDTNRSEDVFVRDVVAGTTQRVSLDSAGQQTPSGFGNFLPSISADGRHIGFETVANLVPGPDNNDTDCYVRDLDTGTTQQVSVTTLGRQTGCLGPMRLSADGRLVAFSDNQVLLRDRAAGTTTLESVGLNGKASNGTSVLSDLTPNGRFLLFTSSASNLVTSDTNGSLNDAFVRKVRAHTTSLVSVDTAGRQDPTGAAAVAISVDGRHVAFNAASALVPEDTNQVGDAYVRDR